LPTLDGIIIYFGADISPAAKTQFEEKLICWRDERSAKLFEQTRAIVLHSLQLDFSYVPSGTVKGKKIARASYLYCKL